MRNEKATANNHAVNAVINGLLLIISLMFCHPVNAQSDSLRKTPPIFDSDKYLALELQYNGFLKPYFEVGIGKYAERISGHEPLSSGIFFGSELKIDFNRTVIGPKVSLWVSGGSAAMSMGCSMIYYSDLKTFEQGSFRIRPELGFGLFRIRGFLGFNVPVTNYKSSRDYVSLVTAGVVWAIPLIQIHSAEYYW